ncbi:MAG TPA: BamA/TamA family outer membrane protein [Kofleriaceae bacterium]
MDTIKVEPATPPEPRELPPEKPPDLPPPPPPKPPTGRFQVGAGFSSDEGFIASATIAQDDLFHTGDQLLLTTRISAKRILFLQRFADPDVLGSRFGLSIDLYNDSRQLPGFTRDAAGGALTLSHPFGNHARAFVSYRLEDVQTKDQTPWAARRVDPFPPLTGGILSSLRAGVVYDTRDQIDAPLRGTTIGSSLEVADRRLGSDLQFTRIDSWVQHHQPMGPLTLHLRGSFTTIGGTIDGPAGVPRSERLFLGSSNEIRGYRPDAFGPIDGLGTPVGGYAKLLAGAELEVPLIRRIGLSATGFVDTGALLDDSQGQFGTSVGFGLLWRSPIGALRFSWAFPVDGSKPAFVFGIGSSF